MNNMPTFSYLLRIFCNFKLSNELFSFDLIAKLFSLNNYQLNRCLNCKYFKLIAFIFRCKKPLKLINLTNDHRIEFDGW